VDLANAREDLAEISRAARLAKRVMSGMLHYARGGTALRSRLDLAGVIQTASALLSPRLTGKSVTLERVIDPAATHVYAVQAHVERILLNLLLNAHDASPPGGRICVRSAPADEADGGAAFVAIRVEDEGGGIPSEILAQVEEPFFTTKPGGTGLGLAICRALAWENGGRMFIQSERGRGTTVRVILPASASASPVEESDGT
jgi:signal transduction histidine kinase